MRIALFSDSHGTTEPMRRAVLAYRPKLILHLGDCTRDAEALSAAFPDIPARIVRGNCDMASRWPERELFTCGGVTFYAEHGHLHGVKYSLDALLNAAHFSGANAALFGHTHEAVCGRIGGLQYINPGSIGAYKGKTWALLEAEAGVLTCRIMEVEP